MNGVVFNNSCYFTIQGKALEFDVAKAACEDSEAHLAYIESEQNYRTVESFLAKQQLAEGITDGVYWIGEYYDNVVSNQTRLKFLTVLILIAFDEA